MGNRGSTLRWPLGVATRVLVFAMVTLLICATTGIATSAPARAATVAPRSAAGSLSLLRGHSSGGASTCTYANSSGQFNANDPGWDCGATLTGPASLTFGKCPKTVPSASGTLTSSYLKYELCTQPFTLTAAFTSGTPPPSGREPVATYVKSGYVTMTPGWCLYSGPCNASTSVPQVLMWTKGKPPPSSVFLYMQILPGCGNQFSCNSQASMTISLNTTAHTSSPSRKGPLKVTISYFYDQTDKPIVLNPQGKNPQKDTIQLDDDDKGEIAQTVTMRVTVKNKGKKTQTNVTMNGPPSFSFAKTEESTATLPVGVTSGPHPSKDIGTLAPGQTSKPVEYEVSVTNNGNFVGNAQVLSTNQGSSHNLVSQGNVNLTALPTAYLWLALSRVSPGLVTAGTQVEVSGTVTNRSQTESIDVDPISPTTTGNAAGGDLVPTTQTPLSDGVILPFAGTLSPGQTMDVEGYVHTGLVPSTRATVTYDPTGSIENTDGTETDLTPKQIGLSAGSSEFDIGVNTTDPPPPDSSLDTVVDNFTDATIKGTSIWALNELQGGLDLLQHPITGATGLAKGVAGFAVGSAQAVAEAASLVSSIYLLGLAADDMSEADRQAWADQIVADFKQSHLKIASDAAAGVWAAANTWVLTLFNDLDTVAVSGNYTPLATFLGESTATGLTTVEDAVLSDIAFQKFAIGLKYTGQVASSAVTSAAAIATEQGGLTSLVSLEAAIRDSKATAVLGKSIEGITAGTNLLLDGSAALVNGFGLTPRQISELQTYCERNNIIVAVRARSAKAAQLIEEGLAVGKNEILKLKNVNSIDTKFLGYSTQDINTVVWAQPLTLAQVESTANWAAASAETREIVLARLKLRTAEWHNSSIKSVLNTAEVTGEIPWGFNGADNGVAAANKSEYRGFGLKKQTNPFPEVKGAPKRVYEQVQVSNKVGGRGIGTLVQVTQDVDLMAITSANGEILSAADRLSAYLHLSDIIGIEHPETPTYIKNGEFLFESKVKYLADVTPGGEPLAIFSFTGAVTAGYFNPALTIFDTATHEGRIFFQGAYNDPYSTLKTKIALYVQGKAGG